jgi:hypothetical protein
VRGLLIGVAAAVALGAVPSGASAARHCTARHSKTVAATHAVRVFSMPERYGGRRMVACLRSNGYRRRLGVRDDDGLGGSEWIAPVRIRRALVAWAGSSGDRYGNGNASVDVVDLRARRRLHHWDGYGNS